MDILRFFTAGSVDDGKSTLIGRLLYDSQSVPEDLLEAISRASKSRNDGSIDLALLTDGLRAEREQGITIDVAYKYFSTPRRKFIIADTPGHVQYTRNMVTGASHCQLAIILTDARQGVIEQTRRHTYLCHLLGIRHIVIAINKMDLEAYSEDVFYRIVSDFQTFARPLQLPEVTFIPISALHGDNVVHSSANMPWYTGASLLRLLEEVHIEQKEAEKARFQVQWVIRPQTDTHHDYRGYAGRVMSGVLRKGDAITVLPSGVSTTISAIELDGKMLDEAKAPLSVVIHTSEDVDISRGDLLAKVGDEPATGREVQAALCWMDSQALSTAKKYILQHNSRFIRCAVKQVKHKVDIQTLETVAASQTLAMNEIGQVSIKVADSIAADTYAENIDNGSFILIDEQTNNTVAAGMIEAILA
jgi:sulfate adenylyltransferase subunit 1